MRSPLEIAEAEAASLARRLEAEKAENARLHRDYMGALGRSAAKDDEIQQLRHDLQRAMENHNADLNARSGPNGDARDAARYRFLKAKRGNVAEIAFNSFHSDIYSMAKMGNVDAAIDKAMEKDSLFATVERT